MKIDNQDHRTYVKTSYDSIRRIETVRVALVLIGPLFEEETCL